jgi:hypothetical protein
MDFRIGDRVRVVSAHPWARGACGTVTTPYDPDMTHLAEPRAFRLGETREGPARFYNVLFDRPLDDGQGGGPYEGAEFPEHLLCLAGEAARQGG